MTNRKQSKSDSHHRVLFPSPSVEKSCGEYQSSQQLRSCLNRTGSSSTQARIQCQVYRSTVQQSCSGCHVGSMIAGDSTTSGLKLYDEGEVFLLNRDNSLNEELMTDDVGSLFTVLHTAESGEVQQTKCPECIAEGHPVRFDIAALDLTRCNNMPN